MAKAHSHSPLVATSGQSDCCIILCAFIFICINSVVYIRTYIHTLLKHVTYCNSQLTLSQAHMLYACIMYTKLHIACMYCINSEQLLLVMFVKGFSIASFN